MSVVAKSQHEERCFNGDRVRLRSALARRRLHVIFVINLISSALILSLTCGGGGLVVAAAAQQVVVVQPAQLRTASSSAPTAASASSSSLGGGGGAEPQLLTKPLGSLQPDQEAYVFTSSLDTERDASELSFCKRTRSFYVSVCLPRLLKSNQFRSWRKFK